MLVSVTQHPSTGSTRRAAAELVGIYYASATRLFRKKSQVLQLYRLSKTFFFLLFFLPELKSWRPKSFKSRLAG